MFNLDNRLARDIDQLLEDISGINADEILQIHYGNCPEIISVKKQRLNELLLAFKHAYPNERNIVVLRIPGRINLMGVHIDHRGGWCNYKSISREMLFCFSLREDDHIVAKNVSSLYPDCEFSIGDELPVSRRGRWMEFIESVVLERGFWGNYLKAGALKLQDYLKDTPVRGVNLMVYGDIPPRSGLSSSSTLVVGMMLALFKINKLVDIDRFQLAELCGEAEWYVGTRGGCGDHAAILLGRLNQITHTGFKPLTAAYSPFPEGCEIIIAQSGVQAEKSSHAREQFNSRIAAYEVAFELFKDMNPDVIDHLQYLRDISPQNLGMEPGKFYVALKSIPIAISYPQLNQQYPHLSGIWQRILNTYGDSGQSLPVREALLFGVTECERAQLFPKLLQKGDISAAGRFMYISHDGDRVTQWDDDISSDFRNPFDDAYLDELAERALKSQDNNNLHLAYQPGGYRCSVPEMDRMVDCCKKLDGVYGAGLTGAGLGGAILVLTRCDAASQVVDSMKKEISKWCSEEPWVERCRPVAGASIL
jgi:N-acetylgalactosamine kinase